MEMRLGHLESVYAGDELRIVFKGIAEDELAHFKLLWKSGKQEFVQLAADEGVVCDLPDGQKFSLIVTRIRNTSVLVAVDEPYAYDIRKTND